MPSIASASGLTFAGPCAATMPCSARTPAQCVNELGALAHQEIACPKDHCARLLRLGLCRDETRRCLSDGLGIGRVILLALCKGLNIERRRRPDCRPEVPDCAAPTHGPSHKPPSPRCKANERLGTETAANETASLRNTTFPSLDADTIEVLADKGDFNATLPHWNHDNLLPLRRTTPGSKEGLPALPPDNVLFPTTAGWALLNFQQSGPRSSLFFR
jgi:hypothetical protein